MIRKETGLTWNEMTEEEQKFYEPLMNKQDIVNKDHYEDYMVVVDDDGEIWFYPVGW